MTKTQKEFLEAIARVVSGSSNTIPLSDVVKKEAIDQAVLPLVSKEPDALAVIASNMQLIYEQNELGKILKNIPYVILKGTAASTYYPEPIRRTLGDIDVIVEPKFYDTACKILLENDYIIPPNSGDDRHVHFLKNGVMIELHRRFASLQTKEQDKLLDEWIYEGLKSPVADQIQRFSFPRLEDTENGLVLLAHLNQHLEEGVGFRHILDWVMFVDKCLPDAAWFEFKKKSDNIGLTTLAKVTACLGQKYLGLRKDNITWCQDVDNEIVDELLGYAFSCGNFGHKDSKNNTIIMVMTHGRGIKGFFRNLQKQGRSNWKLLEHNWWLGPFAWLYQLVRYIRLGLKQNGLKELINNYMQSKRRNKMLDKLESKRTVFKK